MEIKVAYEDTYFAKTARILGNCYIILDHNHIYHYEFMISKEIATIVSDTSLYLEEVASMHHKLHPTISIYKGKDFYMEMKKSFTFELPISILQVSKFFQNQKYLAELNQLTSLDSIQFPVQIIEDEYVLLDNHHFLFIAKELGFKMVDVYLSEVKQNTLDFLYLAKEQNIKGIQDVRSLSDEEYHKIEKDLNSIFSIYK